MKEEIKDKLELFLCFVILFGGIFLILLIVKLSGIPLFLPPAGGVG